MNISRDDQMVSILLIRCSRSKKFFLAASCSLYENPYHINSDLDRFIRNPE